MILGESESEIERDEERERERASERASPSSALCHLSSFYPSVVLFLHTGIFL